MAGPNEEKKTVQQNEEETGSNVSEGESKPNRRRFLTPGAAAAVGAMVVYAGAKIAQAGAGSGMSPQSP